MDQVLKRILIVFLACLVISWNIPAFADQYVHGYTRSNGTYVRPYYRSSPNGTVTDNFSYKGNVNPYTGAVGTNRYIHDKTSPYYQGPDSHGRVGHSGAPVQPEGYGDSNSIVLSPALMAGGAADPTVQLSRSGLSSKVKRDRGYELGSPCTSNP